MKTRNAERGTRNTEWATRSALRIPRSALLILLAFGCDLPGRPDPAQRPVVLDQVTDFGVLYKENCAGCHGADGRLGPAPPLNDRLFLKTVPDDELRRVITEGRPGTPMPAFARDQGGALTAEQVKVLAEGIRPRWATGGQPRPDLPTYRLPTGPTGNVEAGAKVFAMACANCHGAHGQGGKYLGLADGRPVGGIDNPAFLALISDQALRRYVITGRPDLGMPDYADDTGRPADFKALTSEEIADLTAFLASWRNQR